MAVEVVAELKPLQLEMVEMAVLVAGLDLPMEQEPLALEHLVKEMLEVLEQTPALKREMPLVVAVDKHQLEEVQPTLMLVMAELHTHLLFLVHLQHMRAVAVEGQVQVQVLQV